MPTEPSPGLASAEPPIDRANAELRVRSARALLDPTRVQLLGMIVDSPDGRAMVSNLAARIGLRQPTVSHHMRVMLDDGLLRREQDGRRVWYSVRPERMSEVAEAVRVREAEPAVAPAVLSRIADDLAQRFQGAFSPETVARYVEESYTMLGRGARITTYLPSLTARFAADRLAALARAQQPVPGAVPEVLFVCVQNAGRSQMASAILRQLAGDRVRVRTAGSEPAPIVNSVVTDALDEIGVSLDGEYPKPLTDEAVRAADYVVTMGCGDACPVYPGRVYLDWELADPVGLTPEGVRAVRNDIEIRVRGLLEQIEMNSR